MPISKRYGCIKSNGFNKPYSEKTAELIDEEVQDLVEEAYKRTLNILKDNKDKLSALADKLLEKEVIFKEDLVEIFGKRPFEKEENETTEEKAEEATIVEEANTNESSDKASSTEENKEEKTKE